jgi:tryptophan synthase beta subunit
MLAKRLGVKRHRRRDRRGATRVATGRSLRARRPAVHRVHGRGDMERQAPNVGRMKLLGRHRRAGEPAATRRCALAIDEAFRELGWGNPSDTPSTSSVRRWGRIPSRTWCVSCIP